jgi:ATP-dependent DNA ligase
VDDESLLDQPQQERRRRLEQALGSSADSVHLTPATDDAALAREWFTLFEGAGLDGVVAKPLDLPYSPDSRTMLKVKHTRTADCVVGGFRWHKSGPVVGSLVLGLHDDDGVLQHVGVAAAFSMARRRQLVEELEPYLLGADAAHPWVGEAPSERAPTSSAGSRWNRDKDLSFVPLRPDLVVEVGYDHMEGARFRHTAQLRHFRPDRDPASCTYAQLDRPIRFDLRTVLP